MQPATGILTVVQLLFRYTDSRVALIRYTDSRVALFGYSDSRAVYYRYTDSRVALSGILTVVQLC